MVIDVYSIFNAGNPDSLMRCLVKDPGWDFLITAIISLFIIIIVIIMNNNSKKVDDPVYLALLQNKEHIHKLRSKGKTEEAIARSFSDNLNESDLGKKIAYKKALKYLKRI
jgi:hypothetical protein